MREILFRGKSPKASSWFFGYYAKMHETTYGLTTGNEPPIPLHHYIIRDEVTDWNMPNRLRCYEVDPETIGQYIGYEDCDGKMVFEGDIIAFDDQYSTENGYSESECIGEVSWDEETASFQVSERLFAESYEIFESGEFRVVGNRIDGSDYVDQMEKDMEDQVKAFIEQEERCKREREHHANESI